MLLIPLSLEADGEDDWDSVIGICDTAGLSAIVCE
jgi:hypothetical protein